MMEEELEADTYDDARPSTSGKYRLGIYNVTHSQFVGVCRNSSLLAFPSSSLWFPSMVSSSLSSSILKHS